MAAHGSTSLKLILLAVGRGMPPPIKALVDDYQHRLAPFCPCTLQEIAEYRRTGKNGERELALQQEGGRLREALANAPYIVLDSRGKHLSSEAFSQTMQKQLESGQREMRFVIGGPDGLLPELVERAVWRLSLGEMTFPHMLTRVLLLEQLYRAMTILRHIPYHR